ncbi:aromatic ring-hydroxylating dioxygenase subunit alpha [Anabaena sp. CA = ATCC 33047]|uniref:aromatic ring-hydroxylating dioxygenase subunit alpha n=1 Tax=Anabaena sp. (strain CA / ATCC 33047) TaxID=52271 RepID=UPI000835C274|nr:aromatic ring-hydroxylating dioxygenase subunit alpha [Anabaena sp. CA = ATCC 33047]
MDDNSLHIRPTLKPKTFNNPERFIEGWYWVIPSQNLLVGEVKPLTILGRKLVIYRGEDKQPVIADAYCPHMGADLAEGTVEGNELRCGFHQWKFNYQGICVEIPCLEEPLPLKLKTWPTAEKYGLIWVWTGENPRQPIPFVPELEFHDCESVLGSRFVINCHPHVFMINSIDIQHFHVVEKLPLDISFEKQELNQNAIIFTKPRHNNKQTGFFKLLRSYKKNFYSISYWYGSTFTVSVGTDSLHLHIMLTLRMLEGGKSEIQTIFLTKKRKGLRGWLSNNLVLWLTNIVVQHLIKDNATILQTMNFDLKSPTKVDVSIMQLIKHLELQKPLRWKTWILARSPEAETRENQAKWRDDMSND